MSKKILSFNKSIIYLSFSLSQLLFNPPVDKEIENYLYEAKCQLLMYSAIAIIKMNIIVSNDLF
jgi:hypothetical protein